MSLIENTSMDMPTLTENVPELVFVKEPNVQQSTETREIPKAMVFAPTTIDNIKDIQSYLKDNDNVNLLINDKYNGPVDGKSNPELEVIAEKLELAISKLINKNIGKIILTTTAKDLDLALKNVIAFKKINNTEQQKFSQDQRVYELGKLLIAQNKK